MSLSSIQARWRSHGSDETVSANSISCEYWTKLRRYVATEEPLHDMHKVCKWMKTQQRQQNSSLLMLPTEILFEVLDQLGIAELVRIAVTCQNLFRAVLQIIASDVRGSSGAWAGQNLAVLGSFTRDLPPSFYKDSLAFKSVDLEHLPEANAPPQPTSGYHWRFSRRRSEFFNAMTLKYKGVESSETGLFVWLSELNIVQSEIAQSNTVVMEENGKLFKKSEVVDFEVYGMLKRLLLGGSNVCDSGYAEQQSPFLLRNLTTRQFVRLCICDGVPHASLFIPNTGTIRKFSLEKIMETTTQWNRADKFASFAHQNMEEDENKWPLVDWAGHSFDIVRERANKTAFKESSVALSTRINADVDVEGGTDIAFNTHGGHEWQDVTKSVLLEIAWGIDRLDNGPWFVHRRVHGMDEDLEELSRWRKEWRAYMEEMRNLAITRTIDADTLIRNWTNKKEEVGSESQAARSNTL